MKLKYNSKFCFKELLGFNHYGVSWRGVESCCQNGETDVLDDINWSTVPRKPFQVRLSARDLLTVHGEAGQTQVSISPEAEASTNTDIEMVF